MRWGAGNFEDDSVLYWLGDDVVRPLCETIESGLQRQHEQNDYVIVAAVEVLAVLCEQIRAEPPEPERVASWRESYLRAWDGYSDALHPRGDYKSERRAVIVATFDRLHLAAKRGHGVPLRVEFDAPMPDQEREQLRHELHTALVAADAGELTGGETFAQPDEGDIRTVITGCAFGRDAAISVLRRLVRALDLRSAVWITLNDPPDLSADPWFEPQVP